MMIDINGVLVVYYNKIELVIPEGIMVLSQKETTIAYRCPACGAAVESMVGAFALSADMLRLKCPCGGSELTVVYTKDKKVRLTVPCYVCPRPHVFTVAQNLFFGGDLFAIPCNYSGMNICFTGTKDKVEEAMKEEEKALTEMLGEHSLDDLTSQRGEGVFTDPQILDIIMFVIKDLNEEGEITCRCQKGEGEYEATVLEDCVLVRCLKCGAETRVATDSLMNAQAFLNTDHLTLT